VTLRSGAPVALPPRAVALLRWIITYQRRAGYAPSVREMAKAFDMKSTAGARYYLAMLEKRGHVVRAGGLSRALCVTDAGHEVAQPGGANDRAASE
jgi:repressor LexA